MSNVATKKVFIQVETAAEQQEHLKNQRKTFKVLQQSGNATDKENLAGRPQFDKLSRLKAATEATLATTDFAKRKKVETRASETQTSTPKNATNTTVEKTTITAEDLIGEEKPGEHYWERLAERRREALEESLTENQRLHERIEGLEAELDTSRQMLEEARNLVEVLTEMLNENEAEREIEESGGVAVAVSGDDKAECGEPYAGNVFDDDDDNSNVTKSSTEQPLLATDDQKDIQPHSS